MNTNKVSTYYIDLKLNSWIDHNLVVEHYTIKTGPTIITIKKICMQCLYQTRKIIDMEYNETTIIVDRR